MEAKIEERSKEDPSMLRNRLIPMIAILATALALSGVAWAQTTPPVVGVDYFDNANSATLPDGTVRITTSLGRVPGGTAAGHGVNQCALIYVLKPDQELAACCGCKLTPNQLLKLSVNSNLTANTLSGIGPSGTIAIIPSFPNGTSTTVPPVSICNPAVPPIPVPGVTGSGLSVTAWATHVQDSGAITEDDFDFETGSGVVLTVGALVTDCATNVLGNGSGSGVCTCGPPGDPLAIP
jgi:hypothetical protein